MDRDNKSMKEYLLEIEDLRVRLGEAEETLSAIRRGEVDGLVVSGPEGEQVFTLKGAERSYRVFVESMNEGAVTLSLDGTILYSNNRFAEMIETPSQRIIGDSIYRFISSPDAFEPAFQKGKTERSKAEMLLKRKHNEPVPVSISFNPMEEDEAPGICMVVTDLTEHVRQNELLKKRADQLARLSSALTLAEQRERRRIAEILHDDLQQLIVGAKIRQEMLIDHIDHALKPDAEFVLDLINQSINTTRSLNVELSPPVLRSNDFSAWLDWLARWMQETHGLEVEVLSEGRVILERKDFTVLLFQSIRELLFNIVKHAGVKSATVKLEHQNGELRIVVSDEGAGFHPVSLWKNADLDQKFGLISIRERLIHLGGRFQVESAPGAGSTISLIVPMDEKISIEEEPRDSSRKTHKEPGRVPAGTRRPAGKIRILLADDHEVILDGLSRVLALNADIEIAGLASDGEKAVQLAREVLPDVILMDVNMPKMNGLDATRIIHSEFPHIRIIGLSMYDEDDQAAAMLEVGASAYRSKSGKMDLLLAEIRDENR